MAKRKRVTFYRKTAGGKRKKITFMVTLGKRRKKKTRAGTSRRSTQMMVDPQTDHNQYATGYVDGYSACRRGVTLLG